MIKLFRDIFVIDPEKRIGFKDLYASECLKARLVEDVDGSMEFYSKHEEGLGKMFMLRSID